jgi:hypothetical protein
MTKEVSGHSRRSLISICLLGWFSILGADFLLHGGLLARLYLQPSSFLLTPADAFKRIPLGYLAALLMCALLFWLMLRLALVGWRRGLAFGLQLGAFLAGTSMLGLLSISTAELSLLLAWSIGQTVQMGLAGMVVGSGLAGQRLGTLSLRVAALVLCLVVLAIVLQSMGLVPAAPSGA